jgi:cytochrome c-type biogenesis protein
MHSRTRGDARVAAGTGSAVFGLSLLPAFAVGRVISVVLGAPAIGWLENVKPLGRYHRAFEVAGGIVLILAGVIPQLAA